MNREVGGNSAAGAWCTQAIAGVVFGGVFLAVLLCFGAVPLLYDEPWYLETVELLQKHGWTADFLRALPGPAGPLYSVVHYACEPVTQLAPPVVRWVNPLLLLVGIFATSAAVRSATASDTATVAASFFAIPMTWPCTGMALTEIPAVCAYALHLFCVTRCLDGGPRHFGWAALAGIALGAGILGRQPLLLGVLPLVYLGLRYPLRRPDLILILAAAMACVLPVFAVWGGLVPPNTAFVGGGISLRHLFLAGAYAAICGAIVFPDLLWWGRGLLGCSLASGFILGFLLPRVSWLPMGPLMEKLIPHSIMPTVEVVVCGMVCALGIWFFASSAMRGLSHWENPLYMFFLLSLVLQIISAMAVKHQFSSRYLLTAVPLFACLSATAAPRRVATWRLCIGAVIGCISLVNYLNTPIRQAM